MWRYIVGSVTSRDSCYPIGCQILHVLAILYSSLQWTDLWIKSIVCLCLQDTFVAIQSHNVTGGNAISSRVRVHGNFSQRGDYETRNPRILRKPAKRMTIFYYDTRMRNVAATNHSSLIKLEIDWLNFRIPRHFGPPHLHVSGGSEDRGITQ